MELNHIIIFRNHPAAPSLEAFEVLHMPPGLFRENLKRVFNIIATPKEMAYLMDSYDPQVKYLSVNFDALIELII